MRLIPFGTYVFDTYVFATYVFDIYVLGLINVCDKLIRSHHSYPTLFGVRQVLGIQLDTGCQPVLMFVHSIDTAI